MSSIVKWVNTFQGLSKICTNLRELSDGVLLCEILHQLIPKYFYNELVKKEVEDNWILKVNNIKKITLTLDKFYQNELGLHDEVIIDETLIGKEQNEQEILKLVQLVMGVLVECENKVEFLSNILSLDHEIQRELMVIFEGITSKHQHQMSNSSDRSFHQEEPPPHVENIHRAELQYQIDQLQTEINQQHKLHETLKRDYAYIMDELHTVQSERDKFGESVKYMEEKLQETTKALFEAQSKQPNQHDLEAERAHVFAEQLEARDRTITDLKRKLDDLAKQAAEARSLRDELDIAKEKALKGQGAEEKLKKYMKKAEEATDLKKQMKNMEEQIDSYLKRALDAEEESQKVGAIKAQLDAYKQQVVALKGEQTQLEVTLRTREGEVERLTLDYNKVIAENSSLKGRVHSLEEDIRDFQKEKELGGRLSPVTSSFSDEGLVPAVKEKMAKLERENKRLKEHLSGEVETRISELSHQLEDANKLNSLLKKDIQVLKLGSVGDGTSSASFVSLQSEHEKLKEKYEKLQSDYKKQLEDINSLLKEKQEFIKNNSNNVDLVEKLKTAAEKIASLNEEKAKFQKYLGTAKDMLQSERKTHSEALQKEKERVLKEQEVSTLKLQAQLDDTTQTLRNQLEEKDKEIALIKSMWEEGKENSAREQKLMISAFYGVGLELARLKVPQPSIQPVSYSPLI